MTSKILRHGSECRWLSGVAAITGIASLAATMAGHRLGVPVAEIYSAYTSSIIALGTVCLILGVTALAVGAAVTGVKDPLRAFWQIAAKKVGTLDKAAGIVGPVVLMPLLLGAYGTLKQIMPLIAPFSWDALFAEIGREMFFGHRPWEITHALFGPQATTAMDTVYALWVPLLFVAVIGFATLAPPYLRARFFVAFTAAWVLLGIGLAFLLSSAGPCYEALVNPRSTHGFEPLMARLHAMHAAGYPILSLEAQRTLWEANAHQQYGFAKGISAMPSMHNTIAFLYVLSAAQSRKWVQIAAWLFAAVIFVGSVHLGWHYLVDGIVGWAGAAAVWRLAGLYLSWCGYSHADVTPEKSGQTGALPQPVTA